MAPAGDGKWSLPVVALEAWFLMRRVPAEHRAGFRAWMVEQDLGPPRNRQPTAWDQRFAAYQVAEL